ncbi:MAG: RsmD family RNA methyltransferase [bacterium]
MRVIAGSAKGTRLFAPVNARLRPTTDRTKQVLFDTLLSISPLPEFVIDIFAGTGALGIEALSRGAKKALFIEKSAKAVKYIHRNLEQTHLAPKAQVILADAFVFLKRHDAVGCSMLLADPPYGGEFASKLLDLVAQTSILSLGGILALEANASYIPIIKNNLALIREKQIGDTKIFLIEKKD